MSLERFILRSPYSAPTADMKHCLLDYKEIDKTKIIVKRECAIFSYQKCLEIMYTNCIALMIE